MNDSFTIYPPEQQALLSAPPPVVAVVSNSKGSCENIIVRSASGHVFDLGKPTSIFFKLRVQLYKWQRRHELKEHTNG